jgi:hypothetical protein
MTPPGPFRVFAVVLRPSPGILTAHAAILAWAGYLAWNAAGDMRAVYVVLLLLQSFSAATGFSPYARRGHFDQILIAPASRVRVGVAHAAASMATGIATWLAVVLIEALSNRGVMPLGLSLPSVAALVYMSAVAWAGALPFARYSSGVAWLMLAIGLAGGGKLLLLRQVYVAAMEPMPDYWKASAAALVFPPLMVTEPAAPLAVTTFVVLGAAVLGAGAGLLGIETLDVPLVDPS